MINIQLENPSFEKYIKEFGKQEIEKMFLSFLEIKAKLNQLSKDNSLNRVEELNVPIELYHKILAMKPTKEREAEEINKLIDKISDRVKDKYTHRSYDELRDEYFQERGYLSK